MLCYNIHLNQWFLTSKCLRATIKLRIPIGRPHNKRSIFDKQHQNLKCHYLIVNKSKELIDTFNTSYYVSLVVQSLLCQNNSKDIKKFIKHCMLA